MDMVMDVLPSSSRHFGLGMMCFMSSGGILELCSLLLKALSCL